MKTNREPMFPHQLGYSPYCHGRFAHMTPAERKLMLWYLTTARTLPNALWYDVHMDGIPGGPPLIDYSHLTGDPAIKRMWWNQNARRCDAIALWMDTYQVIELRTDAGAQTIGELTIYDKMTRAEWPDLLWGTPLLITHRVDTGLRDVIRAAGFEVLSPTRALSAYTANPITPADA